MYVHLAAIECERQAFKPRGEAEWFKACHECTIQINHDKATVKVACSMTSNSLYPWIQLCPGIWQSSYKSFI